MYGYNNTQQPTSQGQSRPQLQPLGQSLAQPQTWETPAARPSQRMTTLPTLPTLGAVQSRTTPNLTPLPMASSRIGNANLPTLPSLSSFGGGNNTGSLSSSTQDRSTGTSVLSSPTHPTTLPSLNPPQQGSHINISHATSSSTLSSTTASTSSSASNPSLGLRPLMPLSSYKSASTPVHSSLTKPSLTPLTPLSLNASSLNAINGRGTSFNSNPSTTTSGLRPLSSLPSSSFLSSQPPSTSISTNAPNPFSMQPQPTSQLRPLASASASTLTSASHSTMSSLPMTSTSSMSPTGSASSDIRSLPNFSQQSMSTTTARSTTTSGQRPAQMPNLTSSSINPYSSSSIQLHDHGQTKKLSSGLTPLSSTLYPQSTPQYSSSTSTSSSSASSTSATSATSAISAASGSVAEGSFGTHQGSDLNDSFGFDIASLSNLSNSHTNGNEGDFGFGTYFDGASENTTRASYSNQSQPSQPSQSSQLPQASQFTLGLGQGVGFGRGNTETEMKGQDITGINMEDGDGDFTFAENSSLLQQNREMVSLDKPIDGVSIKEEGKESTGDKKQQSRFGFSLGGFSFGFGGKSTNKNEEKSQEEKEGSNSHIQSSSEANVAKSMSSDGMNTDAFGLRDVDLNNNIGSGRNLDKNASSSVHNDMNMNMGNMNMSNMNMGMGNMGNMNMNMNSMNNMNNMNNMNSMNNMSSMNNMNMNNMNMNNMNMNNMNTNNMNNMNMNNMNMNNMNMNNMNMNMAMGMNDSNVVSLSRTGSVHSLASSVNTIDGLMDQKGGLNTTGAYGSGGNTSGKTSVKTASDDDPYADDLPLLEELGIQPLEILYKTLTVVLPPAVPVTKILGKFGLLPESVTSAELTSSQQTNQTGQNVQMPQNASQTDDYDLAGPLVLCLLLGSVLLLRGKNAFGYIYGFGFTGCILLNIILRLMCEDDSRVTFDHTMHILGYCISPLLLVSTLGLFLSLQSFYGQIISLGSVIWCTVAATRYIEVSLDMKLQRYLLAYPVFLLYVCFALLTVF